MAKRRLGVVLRVPQPLAAEVDGLRRALGDGGRSKIEPHCTLMPAVNVPERDLPATYDLLTRAAAPVPPLHLQLGPTETFHPVTPVAYLAVGGAADQLEGLARLRSGLLQPPLRREVERDFVPHVTIADGLPAHRLLAAVESLADFEVEITFDRVHLLAEDDGGRWRPIAEALLGAGPVVIGRGSLPLSIAVTGQLDPEASCLLAVDGAPEGLPLAVTARRDGTVVGAAWGWSSGARLELADLAVAVDHRGQGIGRHLLAAVESVARHRRCELAAASAPSDGAAAALLSGLGWSPAGPPDRDGRRRWERRLPG